MTEDERPRAGETRAPTEPERVHHVPVAPAPNPWAGRTLIMNLSPRIEDPVAAEEVTLHSPGRGDGFDGVTVIGPPPSSEVIAALAGFTPLAAAASLADAQIEAYGSPAVGAGAPCSSLAKLGARVSDDFRRAPRSMRLMLFALPVLAWAALSFARPAPEVEQPAKPATPSRAPASAATHSEARSAPTPSSVRAPPVSLVMRGRRTLEASAADSAARGAFADAISQYQELARLNPERSEFASAARILQAKRARQ